MAQPLKPLGVVLADAENPYRVLQWLRRSPAAHLLRRLALDPEALSHDSLDTLPQRAATATRIVELTDAHIRRDQENTYPDRSRCGRRVG